MNHLWLQNQMIINSKTFVQQESSKHPKLDFGSRIYFNIPLRLYMQVDKIEGTNQFMYEHIENAFRFVIQG